MRLFAAATLTLLPLAGAAAQTSSDRPPPGDPGASTPAPVPDMPPQTSQTPGMSAPPERIAPGASQDRELRRDAGPQDSTPLGGAPVPEAGRGTPELGR